MGLLQRCKQLFHAVGTGEHCPRIRLPGQRLQHVRRRSLRVDQADFHRLCSTETKLFCRLAGIRRCTGQQYLFAGQFAHSKPRQLLPQRNHVTDHSHCRRVDSLPLYFCRDLRKWSRHHTLPCGCSPLDHCRRCIRRFPLLYQRSGNCRQVAQAHQEHQSAVQFCQRGIVQFGMLFRFAVSRDNMKCRSVFPMCHRDSGISRHTIAGGNAGYDLKRDSQRLQHLCFFSPASKDKGVTALEPYHPFSLLCQLRQQLIGFTLLFVVISRRLSREDQFAVRSCQVQH